jgi:hypothetical protein
MPTENDLLREKPFSYTHLPDNRAEVYFRGQLLTILSGKVYDELERVIKLQSDSEIQLFLLTAGGILEN